MMTNVLPSEVVSYGGRVEIDESIPETVDHVNVIVKGVNSEAHRVSWQCPARLVPIKTVLRVVVRVVCGRASSHNA